MALSPASNHPAQATPVGFIGLGAMGAPMARRLASLGHPVLVYDLNPRAVQSVVDCGARSAASIRDLASQTTLVFTCLPSLEALEAVVLGKEGLRSGGMVQTVVDFSTTGSTFACDMAQALQSSGIMMLDAPITGNVTTAGNGKLGIMCSGPLPAYRQAEPYMRDLASAIVLYLGEQTGRAQRLKLLNNLLSATGMAASCEAFILGVKWGLNPNVMLQVINDGEASSSATRNKFPQSILPRRFDFGARMAITAKDTSLTVKEAEELGVPMWIGQAVRQLWGYAVSQGGSEKDGTSLITFLEPWAGVEVRGDAGAAASHTRRDLSAMGQSQLVLVCEDRDLQAVTRRLMEQGWHCHAQGVPVASGSATPAMDAGLSKQCAVIGIAASSRTADVLQALGAAGAIPRTVINLCVMPTACSVQLADALFARGEAYVDAALTVTARELGQETAAVLASGPAAVVQQARPLLGSLTQRVFLLGEAPGGAHLMQQINGSLFNTLLAITCEAFVTGAKAGLGPLTMTRIMGVETGRNAASARIIPEQVATRKFDHGKRIEQACRELELCSDEARRLGVTTWVMDKTRLLYGLAAQLGNPHDDVTRLATHYEAWAGTEVNTTVDEADVATPVQTP